jgi:RNase P subunit RPR2
MYAGKNKIDKYEDRLIKNIKDYDVILCKKCLKYYYPGKNDISSKRPDVYYLYCSKCRAKSRFYKDRCDNKKLISLQIDIDKHG